MEDRFCSTQLDYDVKEEISIYGSPNQYDLLKKIAKKVQFYQKKNKIVVQSAWRPIGFDWEEIAKLANLKRNPWVVWINTLTLEEWNLTRPQFHGVENDFQAISKIAQNLFSDPTRLNKMIGWTDFFYERASILESEGIEPMTAREVACEQTLAWIRENEYRLQELAEKFLDSHGISSYDYLESGFTSPWSQK